MAKDEAILVAAMIGSVGTFGAVAMPWDSVLSNVSLGSPSSALTHELTRFEEANDAFYSAHKRWPYEMTNGTWAHNAAVLVTNKALRYPFTGMKTYQSHLSGIAYSISSRGVVLRHGYGQGGRIVQRPATESSLYQMEIIFEGLPLAMGKEIDKDVDGSYGPDKGRVRLKREGDKVNLIYFSNRSS